MGGDSFKIDKNVKDIFWDGNFLEEGGVDVFFITAGKKEEFYMLFVVSFPPALSQSQMTKVMCFSNLFYTELPCVS